jgi:oligopeptidase B
MSPRSVKDLAAPAAKRVPYTSVVHDDTREDEYRWLRDRSDPDVLAYLEAENAYAETYMKPTEGLQERLYKEMVGRIQETDLTVPYRKGGFYYYARTQEGKQYPILCRRAGSADAPEQVFLDLNELAVGHPFLAVGDYSVSDDGSLLAYTLDTTGFREYTLHVKNLMTGAMLPDTVDKVSSVEWAAGNTTLFYVVDDQAKRPYRLYRKELGAKDGVLVLEETDERFHLGVGRTRSLEFLLVSSDSHTASEVRFVSASRPADPWRLVAPRRADHEYDVEHGGGLFYVRTNDRGRNFRLVTAPDSDPSEAGWKEIVPHRDHVMIAGVDVFSRAYVVHEREAGLEHLRIVDLASGASHRVEFPEPAYSVAPEGNAEFDTGTYRFRYQSPITPPTVFDYDMVTRERTLLKQLEVLGGYDPSVYVVERIHAQAPDGAKVPISLAYRKGGRDRTGPVHVTGYGSYGLSLPASFSHNRISLLDRGFVVALAHVRGGGDLGKPWHDQGRMMSKKNTFSDFAAAVDHIVRAGYGARNRVVIEGGSAGGLLIGAVINERPALCRAAVLKVPFVDVVNTMLDATLPLTVGEFEEWGNPSVREEYEYIKSYCPYTNLRRGAYPAMLVKTSLHDSQVMYWEPAKYVARLRTLKTDGNVLLFKVNLKAGHGGSSGRYDALRESAFDVAFILEQTGVWEPPPA